MARLCHILAAIIALKMVLCASQNYKENTNKSKAATFHFPEYAYKETSKNVSKSELAFIDFSQELLPLLVFFLGNHLS